MIECSGMAENEFPEEVRRFLKEHVSSIEQLEVLLLLRASSERSWSAREVYQRVLTNESSIQNSLEKLAQHGLLSRPNESQFQFADDAAAVRSVLDSLAALYKERPARIVRELYGASASEIDAFAQAFRIRK